MAKLAILEFPDPRLRKKAAPVTEVDDKLRTLIDDMFETMYAAPGIGLAATQVDVHKRLLVTDVSADKTDPHVLINPEIVETGRGLSISEEGCLSFPGVFVEIKRPRWAKVRALNIQGETFEVDGEGLFGRALQHEKDHLTGRLMIDLVGMVKKEMIKRKMKRWHSENEAEEATV